MPSLVVPESGMSLSSSADATSKHGSVVPEVFGLTLSDSVIEDMIKCFQNDKPLQLSLGEHPSLSYGTKTQHLSTSDDPFTHELYRSSDSDADAMAFYDKTSKKQEVGTKKPKIVKVESKPNATFMGLFGGKKFNPALKPPVAAVKPKATSSAGTDAALAQLQSSLATETARKAGNTTKYIKTGLPVPGKKGASNKNKFLSNNRSLGSDTTRSMPSSPALSGVRSPSNGPTSVPLSQQQAELAKAARKPIIHLLSLGPTSEQDLRDMLPEIGSNDFIQTLHRVGDLNESIGKHELRKQYWKELDVWSFAFPNQEDRQLAIDNAVKQYDRMRLGVSEPEWDRLLPKSERGTGKSLSKLQAQIARGDLQRPPKIKLQKEDGSGRETSGPEDEVPIKDKKVSKVKGDSMTRSVSQPPTTKTKKVGEKETQTKKLLAKTSKPNLKPIPKPTAAAKTKTVTKTAAKVLSSEFVEDSDEEDEFPQRTSKPPKPKPVALPKRPREDDVESSDSSIPLSKKVKKDTTTSTIHRVSDSQSSRTTNTSTQSSSSTKTKDTSPQKSSPLASSPPTNASDVDNSSGDRTSSSSSTSPANHLSSKNSRSPIHKRHHKSSSVASSVSSTSSRYLKPEVMDLARKYRSYYPRYEALHRELAGMKSRNIDKEIALLDMHERLAQMKREINEGIVEVS
ncbi:hypothetical protein LHYA1_G004717 [Lachnellula hyalina]|uniref:Uncharacterized protein n=1 Tax=Lachnellula hyalina TaxID=1316788 RepID=A0A8H8R1D6_9HELO|nr:uncharacterized protein LHYA1_G004717 [Lachnellula hyalina]TVY26747.1 hypothetical protein LHYA1_G004717 [Lachnellula hyalina]